MEERSDGVGENYSKQKIILDAGLEGLGKANVEIQKWDPDPAKIEYCINAGGAMNTIFKASELPPDLHEVVFTRTALSRETKMNEWAEKLAQERLVAISSLQGAGEESGFRLITKEQIATKIALLQSLTFQDRSTADQFEIIKKQIIRLSRNAKQVAGALELCHTLEQTGLTTPLILKLRTELGDSCPKQPLQGDSWEQAYTELQKFYDEISVWNDLLKIFENFSNPITDLEHVRSMVKTLAGEMLDEAANLGITSVKIPNERGQKTIETIKADLMSAKNTDFTLKKKIEAVYTQVQERRKEIHELVAKAFADGFITDKQKDDILLLPIHQQEENLDNYIRNVLINRLEEKGFALNAEQLSKMSTFHLKPLLDQAVAFEKKLLDFQRATPLPPDQLQFVMTPTDPTDRIIRLKRINELHTSLKVIKENRYVKTLQGVQDIPDVQERCRIAAECQSAIISINGYVQELETKINITEDSPFSPEDQQAIKLVLQAIFAQELIFDRLKIINKFKIDFPRLLGSQTTIDENKFKNI